MALYCSAKTNSSNCFSSKQLLLFAFADYNISLADCKNYMSSPLEVLITEIMMVYWFYFFEE